MTSPNDSGRNRYQELFDAAPDGYLVTTMDGVIQEANHAIGSMLDTKPQGLVGEPLFHYIADADRAAFSTGLGTSSNLIDPSEWEISFKSPKGGAFPAAIRLSPFAGANGEPDGLRWLIRDITERKKAEEELRVQRDRAEKYLEISGVMIVSVDQAGRVRLINEKGCEVLGREAEDIVGKNWIEIFVPEEARTEATLFYRELLAGRIDRVVLRESSIHDNLGQVRCIEWRDSVLRDDKGEIFASLSSGTDITERIRIAKKMRDQASLVRLGEMAAVVAHEVRNPLAGIAGAITILERRLTLDEEQRMVMHEIQSSINSLNKTVEDLLLFTHTSLPRVGPVSILDLLRETSRLLLSDPAFKEIRLETEGEDALIAGDPHLLRPVFRNLIANAGEAMSGKGIVHVKIETDGGYARISVRDAGPGIPKASLDLIFEPFFTTKSRGTGLGLATVKRIVDVHGGGIEVASSAGGTIITVRLPVLNVDSLMGSNGGTDPD